MHVKQVSRKRAVMAILAIAALAVAGFASAPAWADTVRIVETGAEYTSIQAAIRGATHGQTVEVSPGTYHETIHFRGRNITVRSEDPDDPAVVAATIIDGGGAGSVVTLVLGETPNAVLTGFTITGGNALRGGGVYIQNSSPTIVGNIIEGNSGSNGGGISIQDSSANIIGNIIRGNTGGNGGGVRTLRAYGSIIGNTVEGNTASNGGGIYCGGVPPLIKGNTVTGNSASYGGGIYCFSSSPQIINCTLSDNSASIGGGIYAQGSSASPVIKNTIIAFSTSGAGIYAFLGRPEVTWSNVYGNAAGEFFGMADPTGDDGNISEDPLFAGGGDYHLQSRGGRWDPGPQEWVIDAVHSPCIAAGDPASDFSAEPEPNGGCINMGAYGGTWQASKADEGGAPPLLSLDSPSPSTLWPVNGKMVPVTISGSVLDQGGGIGEAWLEIDDDYGELDQTVTLGDAIAEDGNFSVIIDLMAWRRGNDRTGRVYEISLHATDRTGNESDAVSVQVLVPHAAGGRPNRP